MKRERLRKRKLKENMYDFAFVGPASTLFLIFVLLPFLMSVVLSFTSWNGQTAPRWTGLENYRLIFSGTDAFGENLWFTTKYALAYVLIVNLLGLGLAILLTNKHVRLCNTARTMVILPYMVSGLVLGFIWQFVFNKVLPAWGMTTGDSFLRTSWLSTPKMAFWALVVVSVWQMAGYIMFIYMASLMNIPTELIESAELDGANSVQVFRKVKLPLIMPAITIGLFYAANTAFKVFDVNFSLTNGGPANSTVSVAMDIYYEAFARANQGLGCAKSTIFFIVVAILTLAQLRFTRSKEVQL